MFIQSATVCVILGRLAWFPQLSALALTCVWLTVLATAASIFPYFQRAQRILRTSGETRPGGDAA